jgi:hypothetical protein
MHNISSNPNQDILLADLKLLNSLREQATKSVTWGKNNDPIPISSQIYADYYIQAAITAFENKIYYDGLMTLKEDFGL